MTRFVSMCARVGTLTVVLAGCGRVDGDEFREGVPVREAVSLDVPGGQTAGALLAERADTYKTTREVTLVINGGTAAVLTLVRVIIDFPATSIKGDTAVWGPHTEPLSPNTWRLTVSRLEAHKFHWLLESRAKQDPDTAFLTIISGTHTAAVGLDGRPMEGFGSGTFTIDWDAAQMLPEHDDNVGVAAFTYSRPSLTETVSVDVDFTGIKDKLRSEIFDALYRYRATPGAGGDLRYAANQDIAPVPGPTGTAKEKLTLHSRWQETGAGRADVEISGGDLAATVYDASECWNERFASVYRNALLDPSTANWGVETDCAFIPAEYAGL